MKYFVKDITTPDGNKASLTCFILDNYQEFSKYRKRSAIIICPGGAYAYKSNREAEPLAIKMLSLGFQAFILNYDTAPARFPISLDELAEAIKYVRLNAEEFHINPNRIITAGMSAGGHLAASLGIYWNKSLIQNLGYKSNEVKPNALLLGYSVLTSGKYTHQDSIHNLLGDNPRPRELAETDLVNLVDQNTPPAFIWHTITDDCVPVENSILFAKKMQQNKIPYELHLYPIGGHGLSLGTAETAHDDTGYGIQKEVQDWPDKFKHWTTLIFKNEGND